MQNALSQAASLKGTSNGSRILLAMPPGVADCWQPHLGLGILGAILRNAGFNPLVVDYSYIGTSPAIERFVEVFEPDLFGVSVFSQHLHKTGEFIDRLHKSHPGVPIILGGPHVTLADDKAIADLSGRPGVVTIVRGEAEEKIVNVVKNVLSKNARGIVACEPVSLGNNCWPAFDLVAGVADLQTYPMQLSRGCPHQCVFCNISKLSGRKYRVRPVGDCINEIAEAVSRFPGIEYIKITDDAPNCLLGHLETFLDQYISRGFRPKMEIMQLRADKLTLNMCKLLKKAGAPYVVLGVESADPGVFASIRKGETLEQIERACGFVNACDIPLVLCFVLGLPGATVENDLASLRFAQRMAPVHSYWNVAQPMPGTEMYTYFQKNGTIYTENAMDTSSLEGGCYADTQEYPKLERLRMQLIAQATTNEIPWIPLGMLNRGLSLGVFLRVVRAFLSQRPKVPRGVPRRW